MWLPSIALLCSVQTDRMHNYSVCDASNQTGDAKMTVVFLNTARVADLKRKLRGGRAPHCDEATKFLNGPACPSSVEWDVVTG